MKSLEKKGKDLERAINSNKLDWDAKYFSSLCFDAQTFKRGSINQLLHLGKTWFTMLCMEPWLHDGSSAKTREDWRENELKEKHSTFYNILNLWFYCADDLNANPDLKDASPSNIYLLMKYIRTAPEQKRIEYLHMAADLKQSALKNNIKEWEGKTPTDVCTHDCEQEIYNRCTKCGKWWK